jgi:hypothetical protein
MGTTYSVRCTVGGNRQHSGALHLPAEISPEHPARWACEACFKEAGVAPGRILTSQDMASPASMAKAMFELQQMRRDMPVRRTIHSKANASPSKADVKAQVTAKVKVKAPK